MKIYLYYNDDDHVLDPALRTQTLALLFFRAPPKKERLIAGYRQSRVKIHIV